MQDAGMLVGQEEVMSIPVDREELIRLIEVGKAGGADVSELEALLREWDEYPKGMEETTHLPARVLFRVLPESRSGQKKPRSKKKDTNSVRTKKDKRGRPAGSRKPTMKGGGKR